MSAEKHLLKSQSRNTAARELAKFRTKDVLDVLLSFALPHSRPGIVEALGQFGSMEAIPYFLRALEDDLCRDPAADALRRLGNDALLALVTSALTRLPSAEEERPSSLRRRAKALELIAEIGAGPIVWQLLRPLLDEGHPPIVAGAAKLASILGDANDRVRAAQQLLSVIPRADNGAARQMLLDHAQAFERLAEEMEKFVLKHTAVRHHLTTRICMGESSGLTVARSFRSSLRNDLISAGPRFGCALRSTRERDGLHYFLSRVPPSFCGHAQSTEYGRQGCSDGVSVLRRIILSSRSCDHLLHSSAGDGTIVIAPDEQPALGESASSRQCATGQT